MLFLLGVVLIAIGVALSIALHEIGHLVPAKKFGVKVTQYMVGFGPTVWSRTRGETEYGLKAIPLGGYIRMIGMFPPKPGHRAANASTGRFSQLVDQMREEAQQEVSEADDRRAFYRLKTWQKVTVMFGGPFMNLVIASVLLFVIAVGLGLPKVTGTTVAAVQPCLPASSTASTTQCDAADRSPAVRAGLKDGDRIVAVNGVAVTTPTQTTTQIRKHADRAIPITVDRAGEKLTITITPAKRSMQQIDADGNGVLTSSGQPVTAEVGVVGASLDVLTVNERTSVTAVPGMIGSALGQTAGVFLQIPQKMAGVFHAAFSDGQRDPNSPVSVVGVGRLGGDVAESGTVSLHDKLVMLLGILASLNLALFVFNLIPLLPLDGGHIAGALWEAVKRRVARLRGQTGEVYVDVAKGLPVAYAVALVLIGMSALLMYADVVNPIKF